MKSNRPISRSKRPLNVFITVDTEVWPCTPNWRETGLSQEMDRLIYGTTREGEYGLPFQIDRLNKYGLKAVFFVESLFACAVGLDPLNKIVKMIQNGGQEVQLHIHTEWLARMTQSILPGKTGQHLKDFSLEDQALLIEQGLQNLQACGVQNLCAFRAGNYGANLDTLHALAQNGILYDASHNTCYLDSHCDIQTPDLLLQPQKINGVYEFPISFIRDYPGHYRHMQLCACSWLELKNALLEAWKQGWYSFVLVLHSFELVKSKSRYEFELAKPRIRYEEKLSVDRIVTERFERLCRFLTDNRDKFRTAVFSEIAPDMIPPALPSRPLRSRIYYTGLRYIEQLRSRLLFGWVSFFVMTFPS